MKYLLILIYSLSAHAKNYEIIKDHSKISYLIDYMALSEMEGVFTKYDGVIEIDDNKKTVNRIKVEIQTESIETYDKKRNNHLKDDVFFHTTKHPLIVYKSTSPSTIINNNFKIHGTLEIKGIKKNVTLDAVYKGTQIDHAGKESIFFKANTKINRKDFNLLWNKSLDNSKYLIGDIVTINLTIQAQPSGNKTAYSTHFIPSNQEIEKQAKIKRTIPVAITNDKNKEIIPKAKVINEINALNLTIGFIGFCLLIGLSYYIKNKLIKKFFKNNVYIENSPIPLIADAIVILLTFIYSIWYYNYLYP
jgi:polyisoprenoid-binding protein YceI